MDKASARRTVAEAMRAAGLTRKSLAEIVTFWRPGSCDWTWAEEYADLIDTPATAGIRSRIDCDGFGFVDDLAPVLLGDDGRVWDGHHRIVLAIQRQEPYLMCAIATPGRTAR